MAEPTIAQRFVAAFGGRDTAALSALYDDDVILYSPLAWGQQGKRAFLAYAAEFHNAYSPLRIVLHDEFYSPDGTRGCFQFVFHWTNSGPFLGIRPPAKRGSWSRPTSSPSATAGSSSSGWGTTPSRCPTWTS